MANLVELGDVCEFLDNRRIPIREELRNSGPYPYYGATGLQGWIDGYIFDEPIVLLAEDGGPFGSKTKPIAYKIEGKCWVNNHAHVLRAKQNCSADYLHHILSYYDVTPYINGSTRPKLTKANAAAIPIPLPPLAEQHRLAALLEKADHLRRTRRYAQQLSDTFLQSVFLEMFGDPATNPKGWDVHPLSTVAKMNPTYKGKLSASDLVTFVPMKAVDADYGTIEQPETRRYSEVAKGFTPFSEGDVLFAKITPCMENGKSAICRKLVNRQGFGSTEFHVLRPSEHVQAEFLLHLVRREAFRRLAALNFTGTGGQQRVPIGFLEEYQCPIPPLPLQQQFAQIVQRTERLRGQQREAARQAEHLFQTLLHRAFRGKPLR